MQSRRGWSQIEDDRLLKIIKKYGTKNWSLVSDKLSVGTTFERTGKQCRQRWHNHLNPSISREDWTHQQDQKMFEAHRQCGSRWKEISKLFPGRTDNSIKNHFYSTVRKCLRTISKAKDDRHNSLTMKSIKPSVLSKIVQNPELMSLIMEIGNGKYKQSNIANIPASVVDRICEELKSASSEYQNKNKQNAELTKKLGASSSSHSLNSLSHQHQEHLQQFPIKKEAEVEKQPVQLQVPMKQFFDEFDSHNNQRSQFIETHIECREKVDNNLRDIFLFPSLHQNQEVKQDNNLRQIPFENYPNQDDCIYEEYQSNFFISPSCNKKKAFPQLRLLGRVSRNSHPSPSCSSKHEDKPAMTAPRYPFLKQEQLEINFDPQEWMKDEQWHEDNNN